jgi:hypothetical protein
LAACAVSPLWFKNGVQAHVVASEALPLVYAVASFAGGACVCSRQTCAFVFGAFTIASAVCATSILEYSNGVEAQVIPSEAEHLLEAVARFVAESVPDFTVVVRTG